MIPLILLQFLSLLSYKHHYHKGLAMTETTKIPQLNLFGHLKRKRSPIKEFIQFQESKTNRQEYQFFKCPPSVRSPREQSSTERPRCQQAILYPKGFHQNVKAPFMYLDYADAYLMQGQNWKHSNLEKGQTHALTSNNIDHHTDRTRKNQYFRFHTHDINTPRENNISKESYQFSNYWDSSKRKNINSISNNNMEIRQQGLHYRATINTVRKNYQPRSNIFENTERIESSKTVNRQKPGIFIDNQSQTSKLHASSLKLKKHDFSHQNTVNVEIYRPRHNMQNQKIMPIRIIAPAQPPKQMNQKQVQAEINQKQKSKFNTNSVFQQGLRREIRPSMQDDENFRRNIQQQLEKFDSVKVQFDEDSLSIDLDSLIETKTQYLQLSKYLQDRLERLIQKQYQQQYQPKSPIAWSNE